MINQSRNLKLGNNEQDKTEAKFMPTTIVGMMGLDTLIL